MENDLSQKSPVAKKTAPKKSKNPVARSSSLKFPGQPLRSSASAGVRSEVGPPSFASSPSGRTRRLLLKLSGETLGEPGNHLSPRVTRHLAHQIKEIVSPSLQLAIVIGGGNIWRGAPAAGEGRMDRNTADYMGMLATVINSLALQDALEQAGVQTRVMTAIEMKNVAEPFIRRRALRHLEKGRVVIFAAGTGHPFFSTDTTAALRASEIGADALLKATKVDGIYDSDPRTNLRAHRFETITYGDALRRRLKVMDSTAFSLCMDNRIPIVVFDVFREGNLRAAATGRPVGTRVIAGD
jgi:uridylate kinase